MTDKAALIQKIDQLEGLNPDEKAQLKELLNNQKKYGLVWEDKPEKVESQLLDQLPVLKEVSLRRIEASDPEPKDAQENGKGNDNNQLNIGLDGNEDISDSRPSGFPTPHHIIIEGDNLHALTTLCFTHEDKIDVIYIDPPYNTGKKDDFKYNDRYVDKEDTYRHSKWLSFMSRRLSLAKRLLKDSGFIFISIDDNEQGQLKVLCDEIFVERNFIEIFCWEKTKSPSNLSSKSKKRIEYILCYQKSKNDIRFKALSRENPNDNPLIKKNNNVKTLVFPKENISCTHKKDHFFKAGKYGTAKNTVWLKNDVAYVGMKFLDDLVLESNFVWSQDNLKEEIKKNTKIIFKGLSLAPRYDKSSYEPEVPPNLIDERVGVGTNDLAKNELANILHFDGISYPKPTSLIKYIIGFIDNPSLICLDFFAGSGTTLHSVMELNEEIGGNRQCILVTNNENNIAEKVCYERNKRVIEGYKKPNGDWVDGLTNNHLHYFKAGFVPMNPHVDTESKAYVGAMETRKRITEESLGMLCIKENCFDEVSSGYPYIKHFESEIAHLVLITNDMELESAIDYINGLALPKGLVDNDQGEYIKVYVFSPNSYAYESDFAELGHKVKLCALPEAILNAYRHVRNDLELETRDLSVQEEPQPTTLSNIETENTD